MSATDRFKYDEHMSNIAKTVFHIYLHEILFVLNFWIKYLIDIMVAVSTASLPTVLLVHFECFSKVQKSLITSYEIKQNAWQK